MSRVAVWMIWLKKLQNSYELFIGQVLTICSNLTNLPNAVTWRHIYGAGWLAGIGFTVSLFILPT